MRFNTAMSKEQQKLLALKPAEAKILNLFAEQGTLRSAEISLLSKYPRSTVVDSLARLYERGWVRKVRVQNHTEWKLAKLTSAREQLHTFVSALQKGVGHEEEEPIHIPISPNTEFIIHQGVTAIVSLYKEIIRSHATERLCIIQSTASAESIFEYVKPEKLIVINENIKRHKIIVDAVVSHSVLGLSKRQSAAWKKSMEGRTTATSLVPDDLLSFNAEMWIFDDVALITNWREETCILLRNKDMIALWKTLHVSLRLLGKTFDPNAYLRKLL